MEIQCQITSVALQYMMQAVGIYPANASQPQTMTNITSILVNLIGRIGHTVCSVNVYSGDTFAHKLNFHKVN